MKNILFLSIMLVLTHLGYAQTLDRTIEPIDLEPETRIQAPVVGSWFWNSQDSSKGFEINIVEINGTLRGSHCSVFYNGQFIDCYDNGFSINLTKTANNIFEGTLKSGYSRTLGKIRLTYNPLNKTVHFVLQEAPSGIFFLPKDVVMMR